MKKTVLLIFVLMICVLAAACGKTAEAPAAAKPAAEAASQVPEETASAEIPDPADDEPEGSSAALAPEIAKAYLAVIDDIVAHVGYSETEASEGEYLHGGFIRDWDGDGTPDLCLLLKTSPRESGGWDGTPIYGWYAPTFRLYTYKNGQTVLAGESDLYFATAGREAAVAALTEENGMKAVWFDRNDFTEEGYAVCFELKDGTIEKKEAPADMAEAAQKAENAQAFRETFGAGKAQLLLYNYSGDAVLGGEANARKLREDLAAEAGVEGSTAAKLSPDDYIGTFTNGGYDYVIIEKNGNDYTMLVSLYRLTTIDEGTVSFTDEGAVFNALDANGEPVKLLFFRSGDDSWTIRVEETTWTYFEPGMVWEDLVRTDGVE